MRKPAILYHAAFTDLSGRLQNISSTGKYCIVAALTLIAVGFTLALDPVATYHQFADSRCFWGAPNCFNVLTNLSLFITGITGLKALLKYPAPGVHFANYMVVFMEILVSNEIYLISKSCYFSNLYNSVSLKGDNFLPSPG